MPKVAGIFFHESVFQVSNRVCNGPMRFIRDTDSVRVTQFNRFRSSLASDVDVNELFLL